MIQEEKVDYQILVETIYVDEHGQELVPRGQSDDLPVERRRGHRRNRKGKKRSYKAYFFLASMFIGLGLTASTDHPLPLFAGLGIGFLFFVDPIYKKIIREK